VQAQQHAAAARDGGDAAFELIEALPDMAQQSLALAGQRDLPVLAGEQRSLQRGFEAADGVADRARGDAKRIGSRTERAGTGGGLESSKSG
jgi:hypothetical protein